MHIIAEARCFVSVVCGWKAHLFLYLVHFWLALRKEAALFRVSTLLCSRL